MNASSEIQKMAALGAAPGSFGMASKRKGKETLGQRLARLRKERGITQVELAEKLGLEQPNISDYERDVYRPNAEMVLRMATELDISTDELLGRVNPSKGRPSVSSRLMKRMMEIEKLPKRDRQAIIRTIDAFLTKS